MTEKDAVGIQYAGNAAGNTMVFGMRLVLSIAAVLTLLIAPHDFGAPTITTWIVFFAYAAQSAALCFAARGKMPFWHGKIVYRLDICWYALMIYCSGGGNSFFFPFFFFAILTASFQFGFDEGARITLGSVVLLALGVIVSSIHPDIGHMLLRSAFVLALGYMIAYWGGLAVAQRRRLNLLREVSQLSNPRFGVDHTIASVIDKTRRFYHAERCILLMRDLDGEHWILRSSSDELAQHAPAQSRLSAASAAPLLVLPSQHILVYAKAISPHLGWSGDASAFDTAGGAWMASDAKLCEGLADLLDAHAFISAPLTLRKGEGRLYIISSSHTFTRTDAIFLHQVVAQAFPVIENIQLLDRLASEAASRERQKIARDLHDTTIQPYIGLRHGLSALRQSLAAGLPVEAELDKLLDMSSQVIGDMRNFSKNFRNGGATGEAELMMSLKRQAAQVKTFYDIAITLEAEGELDVSDRMAAEVFQIVNEGMSNIRKHTHARHGRIVLSRVNDSLRIRIENDNPDGPPADFMPISLAERSIALGGSLRVDTTPSQITAVHIAIPV